MRVGFIGLGTMGSSMALNLRAAGYDMVVNDIRREAGAHLQAGALWADSARSWPRQPTSSSRRCRGSVKSNRWRLRRMDCSPA
jgi:6-phosphogluconate dehydrogenase (decarboxylating)